MVRELAEKVDRTGLKRNSKRSLLVAQLLDTVSQLERELKRDVTLKESAEEKRALFMELYDGVMPSWALDTLFHALTEEQQKLQKAQ